MSRLPDTLHFPTPTHPDDRGESGELGESNDSAGISGVSAGSDGRILANVPSAAARDRILSDAALALGIVRPAPEYPIAGLGPLGKVANAVSTGLQLPTAMVGQSVLACASLCTQHLSNVETPTGSRPLSLYLLTVAEASEGKSTADRTVLRALQQSQRRAAEEYAERLKRSRRDGSEADGNTLREPYFLIEDTTHEGIYSAFERGRQSQGNFTDEAGVMIAGYGLSKDRRINFSGGLNKLWDGSPIRVSRRGTGRIELYDLRYCMHWLVQPRVAQILFCDPNFADTGLLPRFLIACPPACPPRRAIEWDPANDFNVLAFWARCEELISRSPNSGTRELPALPLTQGARASRAQFFEGMEEASRGIGAELSNIKAFATRAAEQVSRVAGVITAFADRTEVDETTINGAIDLVTYSLDTWDGIFSEQVGDDKQMAMHLLRWLLGQPDLRADRERILKCANPKMLRKASVRDRALSALMRHGLVEQIGRVWIVRLP